MADNQEFSQEQIDGMRRVVADNDRKKGPKVFDISKPPKQDYVYQEFPRLVYHPDFKAGANEEGRPHSAPNMGHTALVHSQEELDAHLAKGFVKEVPVISEEGDGDEEVEISAVKPSKGKKEPKGKKEQAGE